MAFIKNCLNKGEFTQFVFLSASNVHPNLLLIIFLLSKKLTYNFSIKRKRTPIIHCITNYHTLNPTR